MKTYVFDIEGNGLAELVIDRKGQIHKECDKIHLIVLRSYPDGKVKVYRCNDEEDTIAQGVVELCSADLIVGHNILQFDLPMLKRLYGAEPKGKVFDTLVGARLLYPDAKNHPFGGNSVEMFAKLFGSKKVGKEITDWSRWTPLMEKRCINDTEVQRRIFDYIKPKLRRFKTAFKIEHKVAEIIARQQENGVNIDIERAEELIEFMQIEQAECLDLLHAMFPPTEIQMKSRWWVDPMTGEKFGTKKSAPKDVQIWLEKGPHKCKYIPFNPGSTKQIADRLREKYGYAAPTTEAGNPSITEETLLSLPYDEAKLLLRYGMAEKRLQHLTDWVRRARSSRTPGRIHPSINSCGAATGRGTYQQPNQTACPKVRTDDNGPVMGFEGRYGYEMRSLWTPRSGWLMVGGDASGLQLRCLGHALARWDKGAYAKEVVEGDIHTLNMKVGDLDTRDQSKTTIYAYLFGAGDEKIGTTIADHPSLSEVQRKKYKGKSRAKIGSTFRKKFESRIAALGHLSHWCKQCASEKGFIPLIDGRHAPIRSAHSALNTLLQGDEAVIMKLAMIILDNEVRKRGWEARCAQMLWPYDELQWEAEPEIAEDIGKLIPWAIQEAGRRLNYRCQLDGDYKVGKNWAETH